MPRSVDEAGAILLSGFARFQITCGKGFIYGKRQYGPDMAIAFPVAGFCVARWAYVARAYVTQLRLHTVPTHTEYITATDRERQASCRKLIRHPLIDPMTLT